MAACYPLLFVLSSNRSNSTKTPGVQSPDEALMKVIALDDGSWGNL
jgi:hypothetical protein